MTALDFHFAHDDGETAALRESERGPGRRSASLTLAAMALREALGTAGLRRFSAPGTAVVVTCPDESWVEPVKEACGDHGFAYVYGRSGKSRTEDRPDRGNADVRVKLASGGRVLGVSQDPRRYLPSVLVACADLRVEIPPPSPRLVARVIKAATGRSPSRLPEGCAGLTYDEIAAQIRMDAPAGAAVRRLASAAAAKVVADPAVAAAPRFEDLVGYGEARDFGMALIAAAKAHRRGGGVPRAGRACVLASPPGLGKTTMCASLARSAGLNLVPSSVAAWFATNSGHLGDVVRATNEAFAAALANAPSLLVLDELDALPARGRLSPDQASWWGTACTNVLLQVTNLLTHPKAFVAIVGATNHPEALDPALIRPGRLDRVIHLRHPGPTELVAIVRQHLGGALARADLSVVGELGAGSTGAAAAGWAARALAAAALEGRPVTVDDVVAAVAPADRRPLALLRRVALHEAGHAVATHVLGRGEIVGVSIVARGDEGGHTVRTRPEDDAATLAEIEDDVVVRLAGHAAETVLLGIAGGGAGGTLDSDLAQATSLVARVHASLGLRERLTYRGGGGELLALVNLDRDLARLVEDDLGRLMRRAVDLVERHREPVGRVADALLARRALDGATVRALLGAGPPCTSKLH